MSNFCLENQFFKLPEKSKFFKNLPGKIEIFLKICLEKSKFLLNLPGKFEILLTRIRRCIAPLNIRGPTEALLVRLAPREETRFKK